jgi:hypothetical protein
LPAPRGSGSRRAESSPRIAKHRESIAVAGRCIDARRVGMVSRRVTGCCADDNVTPSVGAGAYLTVDQRNRTGQPGSGDGCISGIVSIPAGYRIPDRWLTRITWLSLPAAAPRIAHHAR